MRGSHPESCPVPRADIAGAGNFRRIFSGAGGIRGQGQVPDKALQASERAFATQERGFIATNLALREARVPREEHLSGPDKQ